MQTHMDSDFEDIQNKTLMEELERRAKQMTEAKENHITAGAPGEAPLKEWGADSMRVTKMPDDPQGVLRVSVGGNVGFGYCVFRGPKQACRTLLKQAWKALEL